MHAENRTANNGAATPAVTEAEGTSLQMPAPLHQEVLEIHGRCMHLKIALADKLLELRSIEAMIAQGDEAMKARIAGFAAAHGIAVNNPEQGRWNFDIPSGVLTKKLG